MTILRIFRFFKNDNLVFSLQMILPFIIIMLDIIFEIVITRTYPNKLTILENSSHNISYIYLRYHLNIMHTIYTILNVLILSIFFFQCLYNFNVDKLKTAF